MKFHKTLHYEALPFENPLSLDRRCYQNLAQETRFFQPRASCPLPSSALPTREAISSPPREDTSDHWSGHLHQYAAHLTIINCCTISMEEGEGSTASKRGGGRLCFICNQRRPALKRPKTQEQICRECFYVVFEEEIHRVIMDNHLFKPGERIAVAASGGKDSTVLAYVLSELNRRHSYGLDLFLLSVDEGITGYRDDSLETVKRNEIQYGLPLKVVSYKDLYGWTMDEIVSVIGLKNNCTFCGVFRRQALDRGAALLKADKLVTGHNADDIAETVLLNILRGDIARLSRCTFIVTGEDGPIPRCKPFKYTYEKEIVIYP